MKTTNYNITHYLAQLEKWGRVERMPFRHDEKIVPDLVVKLITDAGPMVYLVGIKPHLANMDIYWVIHKLQGYAKVAKNRWLLGAPYIRPQQAQALEKAGIDYFDLAGNIHLCRKGLNIHVEGKRPLVEQVHRTGRAFRPAGLKVLFTLLTQPDAIHWTHRKLADVAGVAHGGIGLCITDLIEKGYIIGAGTNARLIKRKELVPAWVDGYRTYLRPKLMVTRLIPKKRPKDELVQDIRCYFKERGLQWVLTGTEAAYRLMHYYHDETLTIFARELPADFYNVIRCLPDQNGTFTVLYHFGNIATGKFKKNGIPIAHPLLVYAELIYLGTDRAVEAAREFRKRFLKDLDSEN